jgi:hypothetical protein
MRFTARLLKHITASAVRQLLELNVQEATVYAVRLQLTRALHCDINKIKVELLTSLTGSV